MSTTIYDRGDTVLISYPTAQGDRLHLRPALVLHTAQSTDTAIAVVPITPDPVHLSPSILIVEGSFEAARMGLVTSGYLNACPGVVVDKQFVSRRIGRCPWRLLGEFLMMQRSPIRDAAGSGADHHLPVGH